MRDTSSGIRHQAQRTLLNKTTVSFSKVKPAHGRGNRAGGEGTAKPSQGSSPWLGFDFTAQAVACRETPRPALGSVSGVGHPGFVAFAALAPTIPVPIFSAWCPINFFASLPSHGYVR